MAIMRCGQTAHVLEVTQHALRAAGMFWMGEVDGWGAGAVMSSILVTVTG